MADELPRSKYPLGAAASESGYPTAIGGLSGLIARDLDMVETTQARWPTVVGFLTTLFVFCLVPLSLARADPFNVPYARLSVSLLNAEMEAAAQAPARFKSDLGAPPRVGGFCPSMLDVFWKFPSALVEQCISPSVKDALKKCNVVVDGKIGSGAMVGAADCMTNLIGQLDFSQPLDRATKALPTAMACMSKSVIQSTDLSPAEKQTAMGVVDGVKATYDEYQKLATLAANLATGGPGVIPDFLAIDASGNDGDSSSLSVGDWLIEADKMAQEPGAYARSQTVGKVETSITSAIANAAMNPTQTLEDLKNAWNPDRALGGTDEMLRQCRLADAQAVWASRRAALEADIASARGTMEHYRKLTYCDLTRGGREFDRMSRREKTLLVEGVGLAGRQPTRPTHFKDWQNAYRHDYLPALADYQAFRDKEAEFQRKYRKRRNALAPLLQDAEQLRQLARTNVRQCTGTFVTPRTMTPLTPEMDEEKELNARVLDLKARMLGFGCSIPMANTFIGGIQSEINNPYQKWASFVGRARFQIRSGRACSTSGAAALRADFEEAISDSFGSRPAMQACLATAREKRIVGDLEAFFIALDLLDKKIAAAGRQVAACDRTAAREAISQAVRLLDRLPCDRLRSAGSRNDQLYALSKQISKPECGAAPDKLQVVYRVSGSGFIPHYAGSSYFTQGHHDVLVTLDEPPTETSLNTVLKEALERYKKDPCDIDIPAIPGLSKTPVVWMSGPQVEFVLGPGPNIERHLLEDTWRHDDGKGNPSLSELRRAACG